MAGEALNPSADEETPKKPLPHPPPARAVRPRPSRLGARGGPSDSSLPPAPPAGGEITLPYPYNGKLVNSRKRLNTAELLSQGAGAPYPPRALPSSLGSRSLHAYQSYNK